jgi:hypothetical protein
MSWTLIWDLGTGSIGNKTPYDRIAIEAPLLEARKIFNDKFPDVDLDASSCPCCGSDFSMYEGETLEDLTRYHRMQYKLSEEGFELISEIPFEEYIDRDDILVIYQTDILFAL